MKDSHILLSVLGILLLSGASVRGAVQPPVLKWAYGGCYSSWCESGWYSSPAVVDVDDDGTDDVVASGYSIIALKGADGTLLWRAYSGHDTSESGVGNVGRTWPAIVAQDIDNDGKKDIVTAHSGGYVSAYALDGTFLSGWPRRPLTSEIRGLLVADLDGDRTAEVIVSGAIGSRTSTWVLEHTGVVRGGWPQLDNSSGYAYGVFNDNAAAADLNEDGAMEIIVPSDVHYICAYRPDGVQIAANVMYGTKAWGAVGIWEDPAIELRGWGECDGNRSESYRTNFAHGAASVADVDGDGVPEVIVTGNVYSCDAGHPPGKYNGLYIFNGDRSRFNKSGFDWRTGPVDTGAPLSEDYSEIENNQPNPVAADLDGDGLSEILFSSYDGRVHAYWLDKTEHHAWPYSVYVSTEGFFRFATEPVVVDLDNDGHAEVIFGSWTQKGSNQVGKLHILNYQGNVIHEIPLPAAKSVSEDWNGVLAAPTLADVDDDPDLEVILNTAYSGIVAYDLPSTSSARILWRSGRSGRVWSKPQATGEERLQAAIMLLQVLSGKSSPAPVPDPDGDGRAELSDVLDYLQEVASP